MSNDYSEYVGSSNNSNKRYRTKSDYALDGKNKFVKLNGQVDVSASKDHWRGCDGEEEYSENNYEDSHKGTF